MLFHSQENNIVIFGDPDIVHCAASVTFISVDGTSSRCLATHDQLVHVMPFVKMVLCHFMFGRLQDKKASTYTKFFSTIDSISLEMFGGNVFSRSGLTVSCDFER